MTESKSEPKKLYRSNSDKQMAGVCGGIAKYLNMDSTVIRVIFIIFMIATAFFPVILGYIILAMIIPQDPSEDK